MDVERRLREAGSEFIDAHDRAAAVIREAADAGTSAEAIAEMSGLSLQTVRIFLQSGQD